MRELCYAEQITANEKENISFGTSGLNGKVVIDRNGAS